MHDFYFFIFTKTKSLQGPGPQSDEMVAETLPSDPPPAPNLSITDVQYSSVTISWSFNRSSSLQQSSDPAGPEFDGNGNENEESVDSETTTDADPSLLITGYQIFYKSSRSGSAWEEKMLKATPAAAPSLSLSESGMRQHSSSSRYHNHHHNYHYQSSSYTFSELLCGTLYQVRMAVHNMRPLSLPPPNMPNRLSESSE